MLKDEEVTSILYFHFQKIKAPEQSRSLDQAHSDLASKQREDNHCMTEQQSPIDEIKIIVGR